MNNTFQTPVLFLIFNRPVTTQQVFSQIKQVRPRYLYVAADGPRPDRPGEFEKCMEARNIIRQIDWECELKILFRDTNLGCRDAVSSAITWFFENVEQGIILEDDCFPDLSFFRFCEILLDKYKDEKRVFQINGTDFSGTKVENPHSYYFTKFHSIWGWASWRRAWKNFDINISDYREYRNILFDQNIFISHEATRHYKGGLDRMLIEEHSSWDAQWMYAIMKFNGLTITPEVNLVKNLGTDSNSTHSFLKDSFRDNLAQGKILFPLSHPQLEVNNNIDKLNFDNYRGKSLTRVLRIILENGLFRVSYYYLNVHFRRRLRLLKKKNLIYKI